MASQLQLGMALRNTGICVISTTLQRAIIIRFVRYSVRSLEDASSVFSVWISQQKLKKMSRKRGRENI